MQEAEAARVAADNAYEYARTQQQADKAQADMAAAAAAIIAAAAIKDPPVPELEQLDKDATYFKVVPGKCMTKCTC